MFGISKYTPQINAFCFCFINRAKTKLGFKPLADYKLISRAHKLDISQIEKGSFWRTSKETATYDYVVIGKKSDPTFIREVLSCYDQDRKLVSRCYRDNGTNTRLRTYSYNENHRTIKDFIFDISNICKAWQVPQIINSGGRWKIQYTEIQKAKKFQTTEKNRFITALTTKRIEPLSENSIKYTFTQFPINVKYNKKIEKRIFNATITKNRNNISISNIEHSKNIDIDKQDKFLPYRILDPHSEEGIIALTKGFLKELGLDSFNIRIVTNSNEVSKNSDANFSNMKKEIHYSSDVLKQCVLYIVETARHEVEHAWQHFMIGRIGKGKSAYEAEALRRFGPLKSWMESDEAVKLSIARDNYPRLKDDEDLSKNIEYQTNYMEVKAREAAENAIIEYTESPNNFAFFEQFS